MKYLSIEEILILHEYQINTYGGKAGIQDLRMLESAVFRPQTTFDGKDLYETVFEKAVALLFSIIKNHPFVDGSKRTGLHAAITFLELNGHDIAATDSKLVKLGLDITSNLFDEKRAVEILRGF
ncbi:MAG: hypothetical protein ACD_24C00124G0001 [uncultured bacterium]|uniref:Type II toxin-antitoxin system death-on-curing family toxin n=1 Tax=candidate division WWE3 bacterium TaxID=2053526 RepID=A0A3D0ZRT1_UNCKA|nr:MAG: hypothetical protein ACD_24C00124G0001 [uncultured bacterium]OGC59175.1 MAG: hypothetical protein A2245_03890 [candidate division WWE3 bacterium RIFOXYA2_FULL_43_12]OGC72440.1 MAG: hypothetical protein A2337_02795 [candidate division WWE3 bacterium RIFOXYB2_FULL_43_9]OGC75142.1 MAG: hypothetical protein A2547_01820 [candidate division WWE3 bacterium RIFOXYD2_FULL_43_10]HCC42124.1 type II toxin-antitoxin system death-on-curing family toxin [candidate division WWE3 bacterium]